MTLNTTGACDTVGLTLDEYTGVIALYFDESHILSLGLQRSLALQPNAEDALDGDHRSCRFAFPGPRKAGGPIRINETGTNGIPDRVLGRRIKDV